MSEPIRLTRKSRYGKKYQIEYIPVQSQSPRSAFRMRRGTSGSFTKWKPTSNVYAVIKQLGFSAGPPTPVQDFAFEAKLGRGQIALTKAVIRILVDTVDKNDRSRFLYSRVRQKHNNHWFIPASAVKQEPMYARMKEVISKAFAAKS
jgi:hypothetical protein